MGSLGREDDKINSTECSFDGDCSDAETQPFDCQFPPLSSSAGESQAYEADELEFSQSTAPFDDGSPLLEGFETQMLNFGGDTQMMNLGGETQMMNLAGETQTVDFDDLTQMLEFDGETQMVDFGETQMMDFIGETQLMDFGGETQVLDSDHVESSGPQRLNEYDAEGVNSDSKKTDGIIELHDTGGLSDDESIERVDRNPANLEKYPNATPCRRDNLGFRAELDALSNEKCNSGSMHRGFTSVRTAAVRASGLAAHNMACKKTNNGASSVMHGTESSKLQFSECNEIPDMRNKSQLGEKGMKEHAKEDCDNAVDRSRGERKFKFSSSTARELFPEDASAEARKSDVNCNDADAGASFPQLFPFENELAGLSYADSQEPGESSQANALDFVDKFLQVSVIDFDQEAYHGTSIRGPSKVVPLAKGTQSLVKTANCKAKFKEREVFDWNDNLEDEGGGEFFSKQKETLLSEECQNRRCYTQSHKPRCSVSKEGGAAEEYKRKGKQKKIRYDLFCSDSKLQLHELRGNDLAMKVARDNNKRNLSKEFDKQVNAASKDGIVATAVNKDMEGMLNVGFDTQMAAEAMEALCLGVGVNEHDYRDANPGAKDLLKGSTSGETGNIMNSKNKYEEKGAYSAGFRVLSRRSKQIKSSDMSLRIKPFGSTLKQSENIEKKSNNEVVNQKSKRPDSKRQLLAKVSENIHKESSKNTEWKKGKKTHRRSDMDEVDEFNATNSSSGQTFFKKHCLQPGFYTSLPIANRTRSAKAQNALNGCREDQNDCSNIGPCEGKRKRGRAGADACERLNVNDKFLGLGPGQSHELESIKLNQHEQSHLKLTDMTADVTVKFVARSYPKRKRSCQQMLSCALETSRQSIVGLDGNALSSPIRKTRSSVRARNAFPSLDTKCMENLQYNANNGGPGVKCIINSYAASCPKAIPNEKHSEETNNVDLSSPLRSAEANASSEASPNDSCKRLASRSHTVNCTTPSTAKSPICMGDEYLKRSYRKSLSRSLTKELSRLVAAAGPEPTSPIKNSRKRREMADVRVLFSQHLDDDIIKQQKKILVRLGASVASSISDATHFVADEFVRTRNMLESIAFGKPVVTHLWLESCGQASCVIDEKNYILRDAKKEKEFGFCLPVSLAHACQSPILEGRRVLITPNTKPGKEILGSLVKAVHGTAVERICRFSLKDDQITDLLILSCEEDYEICVPLLEKGAAIYSSELLLNGIVTQKLEYERHCLFVDQVKRTRSTVWLKRESNRYVRLTNCK